MLIAGVRSLQIAGFDLENSFKLFGQILLDLVALIGWCAQNLSQIILDIWGQLSQTLIQDLFLDRFSFFLERRFQRLIFARMRYYGSLDPAPVLRAGLESLPGVT